MPADSVIPPPVRNDGKCRSTRPGIVWELIVISNTRDGFLSGDQACRKPPRRSRGDSTALDMRLQPDQRRQTEVRLVPHRRLHNGGGEFADERSRRKPMRACGTVGLTGVRGLALPLRHSGVAKTTR